MLNPIDGREPPAPDETEDHIPTDLLARNEHSPNLTRSVSAGDPTGARSRSFDRPRKWGWVALGVGSGISAVALIYAAEVFAAPNPGLSVLFDLHRRWPAFLLLDTLPILLGWIGWLAGSLRVSEAVLAHSRAMLGPFSEDALAEALLDPVLLVEADGRIVAVNTAAGALLEAENLVGTPLTAVLPDLVQNPVASETFTRSGRLLGVTWQLTARRPDGTTVPVRVSCGPAAGHRVLYVLSPALPAKTVDPEREERVTREREESRVEARAKSAFLAGFTREVRARLTRVEAEMAHRVDAAPTDPIREATRHALDLVDGVTDLSRAASGRLVLRGDAVALEPLVDEVVRLGAPLAMARLNLLERGGDTGLAICADPDRVVQVLLGLVTNAVRATHRGSVQILVKREPEPAAYHRIEVIDTGVGLLPDQLERLFEDPTRVELGGRRRLSGVGLPLARQLVDAMGGSISVSSTFGLGTTFTVRLPAATDVPGREAVLRPGLPAPLVIVDQQPQAVRRWLAEQLARSGIPSVVWHDGELQALAELRARAIAIDLDAGDMLLADVLSDPAFVGVPLLAATSIVHDRARTLPDGVSALLDAPFDPHELVPSLVLAERTIRGCVIVGRGSGVVDLRDELIAASWTVLVFGETERAAEAVAQQPPALLVLVDSDPAAPLPDAFAGLTTVFLSSAGTAREQLDRISLARTEEQIRASEA